MAKAKEQEIITIKEFQMWLQGVEDMQNTDWVPDAKQWARIRTKINLIEEAPAVTQFIQQAVRTAQVFDNTFDIPNYPTPPISGGQSTVSGLQLLKTPDIDTSAGGYKSQFD